MFLFRFNMVSICDGDVILGERDVHDIIVVEISRIMLEDLLA